MRDHAFYMALAIEEAKLALPADVPVGAILVQQGEVLASAHNQREALSDATAHAEVLAIREACRKLGRWNLSGAVLYVTLEPCPMCAGAIVMSRIDKVVYGATAPKDGAVGSICDLPAMPFTHSVQVKSGVLGEDCGALLTAFFREKQG